MELFAYLAGFVATLSVGAPVIGARDPEPDMATVSVFAMGLFIMAFGAASFAMACDRRRIPDGPWPGLGLGVAAGVGALGSLVVALMGLDLSLSLALALATVVPIALPWLVVRWRPGA